MTATLSNSDPFQDQQKTIERESDSWITDYAWISGLAGAITVVLCAIVYSRGDVLTSGVKVFGLSLTNNTVDSQLFALLIISIVMISIELFRLWLRQGSRFFSYSPAFKTKDYLKHLENSVFLYLKNLLVFWLIITFFHWADNYGYHVGRAYYQPWFRLLDILWSLYLWAGLPYIYLTRLFLHNEEIDKKDPSVLIDFCIRRIKNFLLNINQPEDNWSHYHKQTLLSLCVKIFFAPLMTIFFCDQFPHLVNNIGYLIDGIWQALNSGAYSHQQFNTDFFNISISFIFSIDVALAWVGYVISSRWVDNQTISSEPTILGWLVCICCYPPFQLYLGLYYAAPSDREVLSFNHQTLTSILTFFMVSSYILYMSATLWFGVRFSNLTHRGIIRKGPFALIRHPAYASKNFAWWCVMFPVILFNATSNFKIALIQIAGLCFMTWLYYLRAITEERHLSADPKYQEYCKQVKYRFIPKLL